MNPESILLLLSLLMADESITLPHPSDYYDLFCEHHEDAICNAEKKAEIDALKTGEYSI
jgi:hypothetical protein